MPSDARPAGQATAWERVVPGGISRALLAALPLVFVVVGLLVGHELNRQPGLLYSLLLLGSGSLLWAAWIYRGRGPSLVEVLVLGFVLRVILAPIPPSLSDDVYRYLWDGKVLLSGENPYLLAPDSQALSGLREEPWDGIWQSMSHRDVETVYPPLAMLTFSIAALTDSPLAAYKALLIALDLLGCAFLFQAAKAGGFPTNRVLLYAWNPLVLLEGAGMGHIDLAGLAPLAAGTLVLARASSSRSRDRGGSALAGALLALGVLIKLVPAVLAPLWFLCAKQRFHFVLSFVLVLLVFGLPVLVSVGGIPPGLVTYGVQWEFNGPFFEPLWRVIDVTNGAAWLKVVMSQGEEMLGRSRLLEGLYPLVYPQLMAKVVLGSLLVVLVLAIPLSGRKSRQEIVRANGAVLGAALLMTATFYPWYLVWVLPWVALTRSRAWLVASATLPLVYLPNMVEVAYFPTVWLLVWAPPLIAWGVLYVKGRQR